MYIYKTSLMLFVHNNYMCILHWKCTCEFCSIMFSSNNRMTLDTENTPRNDFLFLCEYIIMPREERPHMSPTQQRNFVHVRSTKTMYLYSAERTKPLVHIYTLWRTVRFTKTKYIVLWGNVVGHSFPPIHKPYYIHNFLLNAIYVVRRPTHNITWLCLLRFFLCLL